MSGLAAVAWLAHGGQARAQDRAPTLAIVEVSGPGAPSVEAELRRDLRRLSHVRLVDAPSGDLAMARIDLYLRAEVAGTRRGWSIDVRVGAVQDPAVQARRSVRGRRLAALARPLRRAVAEAVEEASAAWGRLEAPSAAPVAAPEPAASPPEEAPPTASPASGEPDRPSPPVQILGVAVGIAHRSLAYSDDIFLRLRPYGLPAGLLARGQAELWPGRLLGVDALDGLSLFARGEGVPGIHTADEVRDLSFPTQAWGLEATARYRAAIDDVSLGAEAGYQAWVFRIADAQGSLGPEVPNVAYESLRLGALLRWRMALGLYLDARFAYLLVVSSGEIASEAWFPRTWTGGVDGEAELGWRFRWVEVGAAFGWRRFFHHFHPEPGDRRVAGGAVDEAFVGALSLRLVLR
ncbi:MAG: hypothetical protein ACFCGT_24790 [Sandaracinaceae bacterium]